MRKKDNSKPSTSKNERKRGRPAGKNRVPLSLVERRARNAQYERERRIETADAMAKLAEAAGCDPRITNPDLLATVINRLQNAEAEKSLDDLRRINKELESQIAALEKRLAAEDSSGNSDVEKRSKKLEAPQSDPDTDRSIEKRRPAKFRKISKKSKVHDESRPISRTSSHVSVTDSHCSNHHLGKTLPSRIEPLSPQMEQSIIKTYQERTSSPYLQEIEPRTDVDSDSHSEISSKSTVCKTAYEESSSDDEVYSENSKELEIFRVQSHQDVKVEFQFLPQITSIRSENRTEEHPDPFTDQEKAILSKLGWGDFSFDGSYSENQTCWTHMDYARY